MQNTTLSIIIPCYNEGQKLVNNIQKINNYLSKNIPNLIYEIIVVNDGSTDNTYKILESNIEKFKNTILCTYEQNKGKGGAVKEGVKKATYDWILFMDADLSTDLSAIKTVLQNTNNNKIIIGSRRHKKTVLMKKQGLLRKIVGIGCIILTNIITNLWLLDTQCGFKAVKTSLAKKIIEKQTINKWAFDVEWLYIAKVNNIKAIEIPVIWDNDEDSKVSVLSSSINFFKDLFKIIKNKNKYKF
jgi:glycosyltransferase involved in cell wall biosynthesis